jgi:lipopolysaccharide transport system ATP-binding protein
MTVALKVENVSKMYRLGTVGTGTLSHDINRCWAMLRGRPDPTMKIGMENNRAQSGGDYVWALKDINLEVQQGEILGIIGRNGAGKTTLLKLLSRVTAPTKGQIKAKGRVASLLEVGTGFHPELTGRENVYLNGAIMGMTRPEIMRCLDEIVEFSGCAKYIDTPVKRYSSGMTVRLGFAVAAHLTCEILIVDEVLAVGDAEFQQKCIGKMGELSQGGRTILIVSHQLKTIEQLCTKVAVISKGAISYVGETKGALREYAANTTSSGTIWLADQSRQADIFSPTRLAITDQQLQPFTGPVAIDRPAVVVIEGELVEQDPKFVIGIALYNSSGMTLFRSYHTDAEPRLKLNVGKIQLACPLPVHLLNEGIYQIELLAGIHPIRWILSPTNFTVSVQFEVKGGLGRSPHWSDRRDGELAPRLKFNNFQS